LKHLTYTVIVLPPNLTAFYLRVELTGNSGSNRWWLITVERETTIHVGAKAPLRKDTFIHIARNANFGKNKLTARTAQIAARVVYHRWRKVWIRYCRGKRGKTTVIAG